MTDARTPKEAVYDEKISPLMTQIIAICKEHKIVMFADFSLGLDPEVDENLYCTTALGTVDPDDEVGTVRCTKLVGVAKSEPRLFAFTIIEGKP